MSWLTAMFPRESDIYGQALGLGEDIEREIAEVERSLQMGGYNAQDTATAKEYLKNLRMKQQAKDDSPVGSPGVSSNDSSWFEKMADISKVLNPAAGVGTMAGEAIGGTADDEGSFTDRIVDKITGGLGNVGFAVAGLVLIAGALFLASRTNAIAVIKKAV